MSCFPTVSERDRNGRRAAKLEGETERKGSETVRRGWLEWRDMRKLEGGRAQQRCKVVGNQGRGKSEAGVWTA